MNNVDLAILKVREIQQDIYNPDISNTGLFQRTEILMKILSKASAEINTNYEEISAKLTKQMNTGEVQ